VQVVADHPRHVNRMHVIELRAVLEGGNCAD
jgi:hypothetical protein